VNGAEPHCSAYCAHAALLASLPTDGLSDAALLPAGVRALHQATSYVKQFHEIEGGAAKASEHYGFMLKAEAELKDTVMKRVQQAVAQSNLEDVFRFSPLLGPLGLATEGAKIYQQFAERLLKDSLAPLAADARTPAVQLLPRVYNTAAAFLQHHLPLVSPPSPLPPLPTHPPTHPRSSLSQL
jgi:hypothetical protein